MQSKIEIPKFKIGLSPILIKEMRSTMRGARTFVGITLFLLFLAAITMLIYYFAAQNGRAMGGSFEIGRMIFGFLSVIEMLMLATVTPPLTASAIASERQRQTFDMLMATPLTPGQVLRGKLLAALNYLFLLMFASLPINSVVFLFGGVSPSALAWWVALAVAVVALLGTLGLFISTLIRSPGLATAVAYLLCIGLFVVGPLMLTYGAFMVAFSSGGSNQAAECFALSVALLHPGASLASLLVNETDFNPTMLMPAALTLYGALAGLLFLGAEARLAAITSQRQRRPFLALALLAVAIAAAVYIVAIPAQTLCRSF